MKPVPSIKKLRIGIITIKATMIDKKSKIFKSVNNFLGCLIIFFKNKIIL